MASMRDIRALATVGLQERERAGIKVRQPLAKLTVRRLTAASELHQLLEDELNVKEVVEDTTLESEVQLDTTITPELREEGMVREWVRTIQDWRKEQQLRVGDRPGLLVRTPEAAFIRKHREVLKEATGLMSLEAKESEVVKFERL